MPAILYGSEVVILKSTQIDRVESVQRAVIRGVLEAHNGCAIAAMYGEMGWRDLKYDMMRDSMIKTRRRVKQR